MNILNFKNRAKSLNDLTYTDYFYRLSLLARSMFKWEGLPNNIDEKWLEKYLFLYGKCMFYKNKDLGFMVAKCADFSTLNQYDEPTMLQPIFTDSNCFDNTPRTNGKDCVLIKNNDMMLPTERTIDLFAFRLANIQRTIDVNINALKTPVFIKCSDKQLYSLKQMFRQVNDFEPIIFGDKSLEAIPMQSINLNVPIVFDKLQNHKTCVMNEVLTFLGVNNANTDKRERLVDDEVRANDQHIELSASIMLETRRLACKQINEMFGLNVSVEPRKISLLEELNEINGIEEVSEDV